MNDKEHEEEHLEESIPDFDEEGYDEEEELEEDEDEESEFEEEEELAEAPEVEQEEEEYEEEESQPEEFPEEEIPEPIVSAPIGPEEAVPPSALPLNVVIEVGRLQMNVKKLMDLQPGNVLDLNLSPEDGVDLVVNGRRIAKGELLKIGNTIGVRILDLGT